jgi:hypothetical protein
VCPADTSRRRGGARRSVLAVVAGLALAAGCAAPTDRGLVARTELDQLSSEVVNRFRLDGTQRVRDSFRLTLGTTEVFAANGEGAVQIEDQGPSIKSLSRGTAAGAPTLTTAIVVLPDAAYVQPPPEQRPVPDRPWFRLDPAARDPLSQQWGPVVALQRQSGNRLFCFTELGAATLVESSPTELRDVPVLRYVLRVDLTAPAADQASNAQYRSFGLTTVDAAMYVDALDRVLRCEVDQPLPNGSGAVRAVVDFDGFGQPADVSPPPLGQVVALPVS